MTTGLATRRDPAPLSSLASLALVDAALGRSSHRELFTRDEAVRLLDDVRTGVGDAASSAAVASIVNDALVSFHGGELVPRRNVVDPLLDVRLALTEASARP